MKIRNETHEPLLVRANDEVLELEPGEEGEVGDVIEEVVIEHSPKPHFVSTMQINGN